MDWLSKRKFVIVCYEKVVRVLLEGDEILRVHGERTLGAAKAIMNAKEWNSGDDQLRLRWMIYLVVFADAAESVRDAIGFEYCLTSSSGWTKSPVLWAEVEESSLIGPEVVQETTDKVVLIKEKFKAARDCQKSYADKRRKPYIGPFEILKRIGPVAYRLRLPEELSSVHDTFHELIEIMDRDREIKRLKRRKVALVKVRWNLKCGPEFTWEHEDLMRIKYPQLFMDLVVEPAR
ncbi:hypothetical protein Tco_0687038 [Tanacetum coccineum]